MITTRFVLPVCAAILFAATPVLAQPVSPGQAPGGCPLALVGVSPSQIVAGQAQPIAFTYRGTLPDRPVQVLVEMDLYEGANLTATRTEVATLTASGVTGGYQGSVSLDLSQAPNVTSVTYRAQPFALGFAHPRAEELSELGVDPAASDASPALDAAERCRVGHRHRRHHGARLRHLCPVDEGVLSTTATPNPTLAPSTTSTPVTAGTAQLVTLTATESEAGPSITFSVTFQNGGTANLAAGDPTLALQVVYQDVSSGTPGALQTLTAPLSAAIAPGATGVETLQASLPSTASQISVTASIVSVDASGTVLVNVSQPAAATVIGPSLGK